MLNILQSIPKMYLRIFVSYLASSLNYQWRVHRGTKCCSHGNRSYQEPMYMYLCNPLLNYLLVLVFHAYIASNDELTIHCRITHTKGGRWILLHLHFNIGGQERWRPQWGQTLLISHTRRFGRNAASWVTRYPARRQVAGEVGYQ